MVLQKAFWEVISGSEDVLLVYGFWKTYIMMVKNMINNLILNLDDDDDDDDVDDFRYGYRDTLIAQPK